MKFSFKAQNPLEWIAIKAGLLPEPAAHSLLYYIIARAVIEASEAGIFEALDKKSMTLEELARDRGLNKTALRSLLTCIASMGYVSVKGDQISLTKMSRKWMLKSSKQSMSHQVALNKICWEWMDHMPEFLKTGVGVQYHDTFNEKEWDIYQNAMASGMDAQAPAVGKQTPVPAGAQLMLDIGGSHGYFSVEICKKHPGLKSIILDLPQAIEKAAPLLAKKGMGDRVVHQAGNALTDDLGENKYDFILCSNLMHHFGEEQNRDLTRRAARALKPGGYFAILEFLRPPISEKGDAIGASMDLLFALSSTSGNPTIEEMQDWQKKAGLEPFKIVKFLTMPGCAQVVAKKP